LNRRGAIFQPVPGTLDTLRRFLIFLSTRVREDKWLVNAGALSYTTLLSLVPLLAVLFSIVAAFPVFDAAVAQMQDFIFRNFVPAAGDQVQTYLEDFVEQASRLTGIGIAFLVLTALMLMVTIDSTINRIWRVGRRRALVPKFAVYWAVLTLGPLLIAVSIIMTSYLASLPLIGDAGETASVLVRLMPFMSTTLALSLLYIVVPNCRVPVIYGIGCAGFAALLFEFAKLGFTIYVASVPTYATIYGALAVIPLFLLWIFISWVIVLLGAELSYCLTIFKSGRFRPVGDRSVSDFIVAYRLLGHLWRGQLQGEAHPVTEIARLEPGLRVEALHALLGRLEARKLVYRTETGAFGVARDVGELTLRDLYDVFPTPLSGFEGDWADSDDWNRALFAKLREGRQSINAALDVPLKRLYQPDERQAQA
jgi:membrane protein